MVFYLWISPVGLFVLLITTGLEFFLTGRMARSPHQKTYLFLALLLNIITLFIFKYFNFFIEPVGIVLQGLGLGLEGHILKLALPAGLSFYTLRRISYILDVHKSNLQPIEHFVEYLLYVSYFPQLISGPIDRASTLVPQFQKDRVWAFENFGNAWPLIVSGLFKKIVIADNVSILVDKVFSLLVPTGSQLMIATVAFSIQVLADFSAYTDLSRALSYLLGIQTPKNFDSPFLAISPSDFWRRWHITLSEWLRDYLFSPLRRAWLRKSKGRNTLGSIILPPIVTMLISGLWHGAGLNFLLWGVFHGVLLTVYQLIPLRKNLHGFWQLLPDWLAFAPLIQLSWLLFRSPSVSWLMNVLKSSQFIGTSNEFSVTLVILSIVLFFGLLYLFKFIIETYGTNSRLLMTLTAVVCALLTIIFMGDSSRDFIYGQF